MRARIERQFPRHPLEQFPRRFGIRRGIDDAQYCELIAGRLTGQAAPAQAQLLAVASVGRDAERDRPTERGHVNLASQRRFPRSQRHLQGNIAAFQLIERMRLNRHVQIQVAAGTAAEASATLAGQPDFLARRHARRNLDVQGAGPRTGSATGVPLRQLQLQGAVATVIGFFQRDLQRHGLALARTLEAARPAKAGASPTAQVAEQRLEEIAELAPAETAAERRSTRTSGAALPAGRRPEFLAGPPVAAQLVVSGALFGVAQHLVGLGDLLEPLLGACFLADIGVIFTRQPAVGFFDVLR